MSWRMREHHIHASAYVPLPIERVFPFFYDVLNLQRITPPELDFRILTPLPIEIRKGTKVDYRLRLYHFPFAWRSEITRWEPPLKFVDEQVSGPYRLWAHTHNFRANGEGTVVEDEVAYRLPFWPLGEIVYPLVRAQLKRIFQYRHRMIGRLLLGDEKAVSEASVRAS
jgi:ligand-binding SRPBCC domain-containing protein